MWCNGASIGVWSDWAWLLDPGIWEVRRLRRRIALGHIGIRGFDGIGFCCMKEVSTSTYVTCVSMSMGTYVCKEAFLFRVVSSSSSFSLMQPLVPYHINKTSSPFLPFLPILPFRRRSSQVAHSGQAPVKSTSPVPPRYCRSSSPLKYFGHFPLPLQPSHNGRE